jgi:antitoxin CcdA
MLTLYALDAPKKAANLSVNSDLLAKAKEAGINLSSVFESALAYELRERLGSAWLEENSGAIDDYNRQVGAHGTFSDGIREF